MRHKLYMKDKSYARHVTTHIIEIIACDGRDLDLMNL